MRKLKLQDAKDILVGCTVLGTGGGGSLDKGLALVEEDYGRGLGYELADLDEVGNDSIFVCPYFCGSIGPERAGDRYSSYARKTELETVSAVEALEKYLGKRIEGVVSIEYGGLNTAVAMSTGARLGKVIVDADAAGRAVPDLQFSTFFVSGRPIYPLAVADAIGDSAVFGEVADDFRAEDLVRALSVVCGGSVGMADHPTTGAELRRAVIPGALSFAGKVGCAQRLAMERGEDGVEAVLKAGSGYLLFEGVVKKDTEWKNEGGFTIGTIEFEGGGADRGKAYKIWFKNENVICFEDGVSIVTVPDLICVVERGTARPVTNPFCKAGMKMSVLGFKAPEFWRTERGLAVLNPAFFGFSDAYVPIENTMKSRMEKRHG